MIRQVLCEALFKGADSDGAAVHHLFEPKVSGETIAIICTAMSLATNTLASANIHRLCTVYQLQNVILEWSTGQYQLKQFSLANFRMAYEGWVEHWEAHAADPNLSEYALSTQSALSSAAM